ncbi:MAG: hypothetical protein QOE08_1806 [Thermoleophilaceae bacterium]|nr:hypothetical protein [Thermoleophilaceae bacterium]
MRKRVRINDPGLVSLKRAARAAIVMPAVFFFADKVIAQPQTTIFAAFGSVAILIMSDFSGEWRTKLAAYLGLAVAGAVLLSLGTLCSRSPAVGAAVMAVVGFAILFSGVINGYLAAGGLPALLAFILAVNVPAPASAIPDRLEGWALACAVGISAVMLLWPSQWHSELRAATRRACAALADLLESELNGDSPLVAARATAAAEAVAEMRRRSVATPYRATGATGATEALAFLIDELDWLESLALPSTGDAEAQAGTWTGENREAMVAAIAVLRAGAARLGGLDETPDLDRLERARAAATEALVRDVAELPAPPDDTALLAVLEPCLHVRELSGASWEVGANALLATGGSPPGDSERLFMASISAPRAVESLLAEHLSPRSAWFRNSVRGAAGLAIAVFVAQQLSLQHAFWVALGTLSVLRSNALGTGSTALRALAGTAIGILLGVAVILAIGTDERVLWAVLPFAVLFAAFAPRAISFAAGQAGFTVVVVIVFDIIQPSGWRLGLVRAEDVVVGLAISLGVGLLFWRRGAIALLRASVADAFARSADYVTATVQALSRGEPGAAAIAPARSAARAAAHRLDDAFRQALAESGGDRMNLDRAGTLVAGATRVRLAAYSLTTMWGAGDAATRPDGCAGALDGEVEAVHSWYVALADALARSAAAPPRQRGDADGRGATLRCLRDALAAGDDAGTRAAVGLLQADHQLVNLERLEPRLAQAATGLSASS